MKSVIFTNLYSYLRIKSFNPSDVILDSDGDVIQFTIVGFGKSGNASVRMCGMRSDSVAIHITTRYNTVDAYWVQTEYQAFSVLSDIAWRWYINYKDSGYGIPEVWEEHWLSQGLIKKVVQEKYVIA